jgi:cytidine deaminase
MNKTVMSINRNISFSYKEFADVNELDPVERELVLAAADTAKNAYAPYSGFRVGAAVRLDNGKIICGCNIENAAFPSGICAERTAISSAVSNHPENKIIMMAIAALTDQGFSEDPVSPCGNCRQVIAEEEFRNRNMIKIILSGKNRILTINSVSDLLPLQFNKMNLPVNLL